MAKPPSGPTRRDLLKGLASVWATQAVPAAKLVPALDAAASGWPEHVLPLLTLLSKQGVLGIFNTVRDLQENTLKAGWLQDDDGSYAKRLKIAWQGNVMMSAERLKACEKLDSMLASNIDMKPAEFFALIKRDMEQFKSVTLHRTTKVMIGWQTESIKSYIGDTFDLILTLPDRYPALKNASSFKELLTQMRRDIAQSLELPLMDGCLDDLLPGENLDDLPYLLEKAPELFPPEKLPTFRRLAEDLQANGRQTISLEELQKPKEDWQLHAKNLPYRLGLTPAQEKPSEWVENYESQRLADKPRTRE